MSARKLVPSGKRDMVLMMAYTGQNIHVIRGLIYTSSPRRENALESAIKLTSIDWPGKNKRVGLPLLPEIKNPVTLEHGRHSRQEVTIKSVTDTKRLQITRHRLSAFSSSLIG